MPGSKIHLSFYRFFRLEDLPNHRVRLKSLCRDLELRGTILIAPEGINAMVTGHQEAVTKLRAHVKEAYGIRESDFKEAPVPDDAFNRMLVKIKKEIITIGDPELRPDEFTAPRVSPRELKTWLDEKRPVRLLDTRNLYEIEVGTFKGAEPIGIDTSRDFADQARAWSKSGKPAETIVTFCTGGIRCEKGASLLLKLGLKDVYQLDGGILRYFEENGSAHYDGHCFVFDGRNAVNGSLEPVPRSDDPNRSFGRHVTFPKFRPSRGERRAKVENPDQPAS